MSSCSLRILNWNKLTVGTWCSLSSLAGLQSWSFVKNVWACTMNRLSLFSISALREALNLESEQTCSVSRTADSNLHWNFSLSYSQNFNLVRFEAVLFTLSAVQEPPWALENYIRASRSVSALNNTGQAPQFRVINIWSWAVERREDHTLMPFNKTTRIAKETEVIGLNLFITYLTKAVPLLWEAYRLLCVICNVWNAVMQLMRSDKLIRKGVS